MFQEDNSNSSVKWMKRVLDSDNIISSEEIECWCDSIEKHPRAPHVKYLACILKHDKKMFCEISGAPMDIAYRLASAIDDENENPWKLTPLTIIELQKILQHNFIFVPNNIMERIFKEIDMDSDGRITSKEYLEWVHRYRPSKTYNAAKQRSITHQTVCSTGFWKLLASLAGIFLLLGPDHYWPSKELINVDSTTEMVEFQGFPPSTSYQIARILLVIGAMENLRQAWTVRAFEYDHFERETLEFKSAIENATDRLEEKQRQQQLAD